MSGPAGGRREGDPVGRRREEAAGGDKAAGGDRSAGGDPGAVLSHAVAAAWGLAEATLFVIVPDVWLTALGVRDLRRGLVACGWALAGALAGGALVHAWGAARPDEVVTILDRLPAISTGMLDRVAAQLEAHGAAATFLGPILGTPYKAYAALAPQAGVGLLPFLLASVPARLVRFVLLVAAARLAARRLLPDASGRARLAALLALWILFYVCYFAVVPG